MKNQIDRSGTVSVIVTIVLLAALMSGCDHPLRIPGGNDADKPTATPTSTATATETATQSPTATATATATAVDTGTLTKTATATGTTDCEPEIVFKTLSASDTTVNPGASGVVMMRFSLTAKCADQRIRQLLLELVAQDFVNTDPQPFRIGGGIDPASWNFRNIRIVDADGKIVAGPLGSPRMRTLNQQAGLDFVDEIGLTVDISAVFMLLVDIPAEYSSGLAKTSYRAYFDGMQTVSSAASNDFIMTVESNGGPKVTVEDDPGAFNPLTVRVADDTPASRLITANTVENPIARIEFSGAPEPISVSRITFAVNGSNLAGISSLRIFDGSGTLFCSGALNSQGMLVCANDAGLFAINGATVITVRANVEQIDGKRVFSGDAFQGGLVIVPAATVTPVQNGVFVAIGTKTGKRYMPHEALFNPANEKLERYGNMMTLRKTQPTVATVPLSDSEKTITNDTYFGYRQTFHRFSITAASNADVSIKRISVDSSVTKTGVAFYELHVGGQVFYADVSNGVNGIVFSLTKELLVSAGTTAMFEVSADVYAGSKESAIVTSLLGDDSVGQNFLWSDNSASEHSLTSPDWWNGYLVNRLPTVSQTLLWQ